MDEALGEIGSQNGSQNEKGSGKEPHELQESGTILVSLNFTSWNQIGEWLRRVEALRYAA
jgi:hypothetical protein